MASMMHYNPRCYYGGLYCCPVQGSRMTERRAIQQEIEMELSDEQTEERYLSDREDADDHHMEYWYGQDSWSTETGDPAVQHSWVPGNW